MDVVVYTSHDGHHALMVAIVYDVVKRTQIQLVVDTVPEVVHHLIHVLSHHVELNMLDQGICRILDVFFQCGNIKISVFLLLERKFSVGDPLERLVR